MTERINKEQLDRVEAQKACKEFEDSLRAERDATVIDIGDPRTAAEVDAAIIRNVTSRMVGLGQGMGSIAVESANTPESEIVYEPLEVVWQRGS